MTPTQFRSLMSFAYTLAFAHGVKWMASDASSNTCAKTISDKLDEDLPLLISKANFDQWNLE